MAKWKRSGADALREYEQSSNYVGSIGVTPMNERSTSEAGGKWKRSGADALREYEQSSSFPQTLQVRKYNAEDRNYDQFAAERYSAQVNAQRRDTNRYYQEQVNAAAQAFDNYHRYSSSGAAKNAAHQNYEDAKYRQELARQQMSGKRLTESEKHFLENPRNIDPDMAAQEETAKERASLPKLENETEEMRRQQILGRQSEDLQKQIDALTQQEEERRKNTSLWEKIGRALSPIRSFRQEENDAEDAISKLKERKAEVDRKYQMDANQYKVYQTYQRSERPEAYTAENVGNYKQRLAALASVYGTWTKEQEQEAKEAIGTQSGGTGLLSAEKNVWAFAPYQEAVRKNDKESARQWEQIYNALYTRLYSGQEAVASGLMQGLGFEALGDVLLHTSTEMADEAYDRWAEQKQNYAYAQSEHPYLASGARIAGSLALMSGVGKAAGAGLAATGLKTGSFWFNVARGSLTFAGVSAIQNSGAAASGDISGGDYLKSIAVSGAQGAAGNIAGELVGSGLANVLRKNGLMTPFFEFVRQTASGMSNATVNQAIGYAAADKKPTRQEIAEGLVTSFLFSALSSAISTYETTNAQKARMQQAYNQIEASYQAMAAGTENMTPEAKAQRVQLILQQTQSLRAATGEYYIAGQQKAVNNLNSALDAIEDWANNYLNGYQAAADSMQPKTALPGGTTGQIPSATVQPPVDPNLTQEVANGLQTAITQGVIQADTPLPMTGGDAAAGAAQSVSQNLQARGLDAKTADALVKAATEMQQEAASAPSGGQNSAPTETVAPKQNTAQAPAQDAAQAETLASTGSEASTPKQEPPKTAKKAAAPAKTRTTEAASMEPIAKTLGASGQKAIFNAYDGKMDTAEYAGEFVKVYNAARAGNDLPETKTLAPWQKYAAEVAGKNDMEPQAAQEIAAVKPEQTSGQTTEETPFKPGMDYSDYVKAAVRDGEMTTETAQQIDTVAKQLGVRVRFADEVAGGTANAELSGNEVLIEKHNNNPVMFLLGHELTHRIQETAPEQYQQFREAIIDEIRPQAQSVMENYAQRGYEITEEAALDEAAADYAGRMIDDGEVLDDFIEKHRDDRTLLQKIIDAIRSFIRKLTGAERKKAETAEGKLLAAMDAAAENVKKSNGLSGTSSGETRYVIKKDAQGNEFVDAPIWALDVKSQKDVGAALSELVRTKFNSWIDVYGQKIGINQKTANEWTFSKDAQNLYRKNKPAYADKVNAFGVADELLQASRDYVGEEIKHTRKDSFREFARGTVNFRVGANGYSADVVVGTTKNGAAVLYDIVDIQPIKITEAPNTTLAAQGATDRRLDASDNPIVDANSENVNGKLSVKGAEVSREYADVLKENELLKERVDYWKGQTKRTVRTTTNEKSVGREATSLVKRYGAELDAADIQGDLQSLYDAMANGELDGKEAFSQAKEIAGKLVENAVEADDELYQSYKDLRDFLRTTKLTISEEDGKNVPDLAELRKRNFGRMTIGKGQTNIDQVYQELADQWPEFFDEDAVSHPADQLQQIADVLGNIYTITEQNPYQGYMEQAKTAAANEILDDFFELPQTRKTFADRQAAALSEAKAKGKAQAQKVREQKNAQLADLREKNRARVNSILEKERTRRADQINKLKEQYKSRDTAAKDRREARELRNKIIRHTKGLSQKLLRPTDKQHIPEILKHEVAAMLESINMEDNYTLDPATIREGKVGKDGKTTLYGEKLRGADRNEKGVMTRRSEAFEALKAKYTQIVKDGDAMTVDPYLLGDNSEGIRGGFDEVIAMKDTPLSDLSKSQLQTVWNVVRAVEHSVSTYGKMLSNAKYAQTGTWAEAIRNDVSERRPIRKRTTRLTLDLETPYTFFSHYGDSGKAIYRMLRDAQDQQQLIVDRITEETQKIVDPKTVKQLEKQTHTFQTASGKTLTLTTAQAMEIYNLMQRKQALEHLTTGGIIQPEIKSAKIGRGFEAIRLTEADLQQIAGSLTAEQVKIADGLQGMTTGLLADYGNDASMRAYGYKKFTEKNYWPIRSAREGVQSTVEKGGNQPRSIQNVGLAKPLTPGANNPLDIPGIFTTFANHAAEMTDYAAWLCTMEDANHLFNYQFRDENGLPTGRNIRQILDEYGGRGAQSYWRSLMDNIQNGINLKEFGPMTDFAGKAISGFKGAAVGGNIRVVIQQPTAFFRAAAVLDPADMAKGLVKGVKGQGGWSRALEYSPIAMRKDNGGFDISAPYTMKETLFDTRTAVRKLNDTLSAPAGAADAVTWGRLWNACEWTVHRENPYLEPGSKAFYEQTAKQFAEVIDQTQVVDGVLQRSNIMRNKGEIAKQATSFMGEPIMSLNLLIRSWDNIRYEQEPRKRSKAIKTFGRAVMALVVTAAVNAMAQSLIDAIRDDDPDKDYKERYMAAFTGISGDEETTWQKAWNAVMEGNLGGNLNYVGNIPYVKDFLSLLQGYEVNRMDTEVVGDLVDAGKMFVQNVDGNGTKTSAYAVKSLLGAASKVYGVPVNNLTRDLWGMVRSVAVETKNIPVQYEMEKAIYNITNNKNKSRYISILYRALEQGDVDSFQHIRSDLMNTMGLDGAEIDESLRSRYNKAVKKDPAYTLPQAARDLIGSRDKYKEETTDEKFSAKDLNETQYLAYSDQRATDYREIEDALKDSDTYQSLDAKTRSKLIEAAYDLVEQQSLEDHSDGQYEITTKWMTLADDAEKIGIEPYMYVTFHVVYNTTESTKGADGKAVKGQSKSDKIRKWLKDNRDLTEQQRKFLWEAVYESDW
jgi:hypothetical protein